MADRDVILLVEDEPLVRDSIVLDLEDAGFEVMTAENGDDASYILPKMQRIDLLLTDIRMPGRINGWHLAEMARCRRPNLPIIYTSAFPPQLASKVEGSVFLAKPYRVDEILNAIEDLKLGNEELSSTNQKLLLANEELETSKCELQSLNETLPTANAKLMARADALSHAGCDSTDILNGMQIATIFLDRTFAVKYFTPSAKNIFDLVESDIGRPISHIHTRLRLNSVQEDAERVLRTFGTIEKQVDSHNGAKRYIMRMLPYRTLENVMVGVVLTFVDVTRLAVAESESFRLARELQSRVEKLEQILDLLPAGLFVIGNDPAQHVQINRYGLRLLGEKNDKKGPRDLLVPYRLFDRDRELAFWEQPLQRAVLTGQKVPAIEGRLMRRDGSSVEVIMSAEPLLDELGSPIGAVAAIIDISEGAKADTLQAALAHISGINATQRSGD